MKTTSLSGPLLNPAPLFELYRSAFASDILVAALSAFPVFDILSAGKVSAERVRRLLHLPRKSADVFFTALRAFGLIHLDSTGRLELTATSREFLVAGGEFYAGDYFKLRSGNSGITDLIQCLLAGQPLTHNAGGGKAFVAGDRDDADSPMDDPVEAPKLTRALAGRARIVAPALAQALPRNLRHLLDLAGGSGLYSIAAVRKNPQLRVTILDREAVLGVARDNAQAYGVTESFTFQHGDMFKGRLPAADGILLSNVLHDWDQGRCRRLLRRCFKALPRGGRLFIHDVFLNDSLSGPLHVALYSVHLFMLTYGRAYSRAEYVDMLTSAGFTVPSAAGRKPKIKWTGVHCGVLTAVKR